MLPTDSIQGSEHIVKSLALFLAEKEFNCRVIILTRRTSKGWENLEGIMQISYLPFSSYFVGALSLIPYLAFKNYKKVDYTFSSQTVINGTLGLAKRIGLLKAKVILRESNSIFDLLNGYKLTIYTLFYTLGYKGSSLVICQTDFMKKRLIKSLPKLTKNLKIMTISNPFNFADIDSRSGDIAPEFQKENFLIAAGRLAHAKGFDILIDAFYEIAKKQRDLCLIILGEGHDRQKLTNKIKVLGLEDRIYMPGYVNNVYAYFKRAKVCILSSRIEGFPNVLLQMMSQNTSVVATLSAGGIEKIPGIFTCPPEDIIALTNTIQQALNSTTSYNRKIFDAFLMDRTQAAFFTKIMENIEKTI